MKQIQTITEQTYQAILNGILTREFAPGTRLGTKFLEEKLGVSSSPIREALTRLMQDGLIEYRPNVGMRVTTFTPKDVQEIFSLVRELDAVAMRFAFEQPTRAEMLRTEQALSESARRALLEKDYEKWENCSDDFHLLFYKYADNSRLSSYADKVRLQLTVFSVIYQKENANREIIQQEHDAILSCLLKEDLPAAEKKLRCHFDSTAALALTTLKENM